MLPAQEKCLFAASGQDLKSTSMSRNVFVVQTGSCELKQSKPGFYQWIISDSKSRDKKRVHKFANKGLVITSHSRPGGLFTIILKDPKETTQLSGKLSDVECKLLINAFEGLKNTSNNAGLKSPLRSAQKVYMKENDPSTIKNARENSSCPSSKNNKSPMTKIMERNVNSLSKPLQDRTSLGAKMSLKNESDPTGHGERTPLGDRKGVQTQVRSNVSQRLFPTETELGIGVTKDDMGVSAIGGLSSRSAAGFYSDKKVPKKPITVTYARKRSLFGNDGKSWSFAVRDGLSSSNSGTSASKDLNETSQVVGFSNLGNTCYMNSILQCLLNIPNFFQDLNNHENLEVVQHTSLYNCLCNLGILKYSYETLENQKFALKRVKTAISSAAHRFSGYAQHDAHELLCQCLDQLQEDLYNETKKQLESRCDEPKLDSLKEEGCLNCPIKLNFESTVVHSIACQNCDDQVLKEEVCRDFSLVIPETDENTNPEGLTINNLLKLYFANEVIEYSCEKCNGSYSLLSHHFSKLPRVLVIHIKRYDINDSKKTDRISIPKTIDISLHSKSETKSAPKFQFNKDKLKAKFDSSMPKTVSSAEKRKSPSRLDMEPLQKHQKSCDIDTKPSEDENKEEEKACNSLVLSPNGKLEADIDDMDLASAIEESKKHFEEQKFTKVQTVTLDDAEKELNKLFSESKEIQNPSIETDLNKTFEYGSTISNNDLGLVGSTFESEEDQLKRALDLSLQEYEKGRNVLPEEDNPVLAINPSPPKDNLCVSPNIISADNANKYTLVGVVNHHGQNTATGHYTSDSYDFKSKKWRLYNDSSVKEVTEHEVRYGRLHSAYIVFYMQDQCFAAISNS